MIIKVKNAKDVRKFLGESPLKYKAKTFPELGIVDIDILDNRIIGSLTTSSNDRKGININFLIKDEAKLNQKEKDFLHLIEETTFELV